MKTKFNVLIVILTLLGKGQQNEFLEVDMQFDNGVLQSLSTHLVSNIPITTQKQSNTDNPITIQIPTQILPTIINDLPTQIPQIFTLPIIPINQELIKNLPAEENGNFNGCMIVPTTSATQIDRKLTETNTIQVTNTVIETVKIMVPEVKKKRKMKKIKIPKIKHKKKRHHKKETKAKKISETTEIISLAVVTPTVKINLQEKRKTDIDVNEIWEILESNSNPKKDSQSKSKNISKPKLVKEKKTCPDIKIKEVKKENLKSDSDENVKKNVLEERLKKLENMLLDNKYKIKKEAEEKKENVPIKSIIKDAKTHEAPFQVYQKDNNDLKQDIKKFHTLPAKKKKGSCLVEQTVIIPASKIYLPTIPPPLISNIAQNVISGKISDNLIYNSITNYAGMAVTTVTSLTIVPVPTTHLTVKTETIFTLVTELLTEVLYTPYTVTTTATNTMYMIKMTTVNGAGCRNCELDSNGMVLPAGQMPPGIFATPINEVDPNKFDIVGYAGMNPINFNPHLQGFNAQVNM